MSLKAVASCPISSDVVGSTRWTSSPREIATAPGRELPDGPRDPAGDQGRGQSRPGQDEDGQQDQLAPGGGDLRFHPAAREPDPGRAPALGVDPDRHREVVERLPVRPVRAPGRAVASVDRMRSSAPPERRVPTISGRWLWAATRPSRSRIIA